MRAMRSLVLVALVFAALVLVAGCGDRETPSQPAPIEPRDLAAAKQVIERYVVEQADKNDYDEMVVRFEGTPVELTLPMTLDIEYGSGHGNHFDFLRLGVDAERALLERVTWDGARRSRSQAASASVERAEVDTQAILPVLDLIRSLSVAKAERRRKPDAPLGGSSGGSTADFFVLVRVLDKDGKPVFTDEYAGYRSSTGEVDYLPLLAVQGAGLKILESEKWIAVAAAEVRTSHFTDAFRLNREVMLKPAHWWVMEHSLEALAWLGRAEAVDTVRYLRDNYPSPLPRQTEKMERLLSDPDRYLAGAPKDLSK